jgi:murein DD-endopeptidase MepM/ murein hydrolase activator NlpD
LPTIAPAVIAGAASPTAARQASFEATPFPERPVYPPGELVDYIAQPGDTLPILAVHFNTNVADILEANPFIPKSATTMPPGMPMKIPIYYAPFWGDPYQILPDGLYVDGPSQVGFDTAGFVSSQPGWLKDIQEYADNANRSAAEIVDLVALNYSVSPRLLLALLEYQSGALTQNEPSETAKTYPMAYPARERQGLYRQLIWTANTLNNGYYGWRTGHLTSLETSDGRLERFDPWQNAASVALHYFFNKLLPKDAYLHATAPDGFALTYKALFGDPWTVTTAHIPGSLEQPALTLPFRSKEAWALTGGPHTGWGLGEPYAALDFAPPNVASGCVPSSEKATAVADGVVVRSDTGIVILDLDGDGDERTGWEIMYLHVATQERVPVGAHLKTGDPVGYPSCEGGEATGTHIHLARKYNGEWIPAGGELAFNLGGWIAHNGADVYLGTLTRLSRTVTACVCSNQASFIQIDLP